MIESSPSRAVRLGELRDEQARRWHEGNRSPAEAYLADDPDLHGDAEALLELLYQEIVIREELGERPGPDEYARRYPQHEAALRRQFVVHRLLDVAEHVESPPTNPSDTLPHPVAAPATGTPNIPGYEILGEVGRGGMGVVYKARQLSAGRLVALKMILRGPGAAPDEVLRFRLEAEAAARLDHPNIVPIYEVGEHGGQPFFSMKLVEGDSLAQCLAARSFPEPGKAGQRQAARLVAAVARAVHHAHQHGILHRDLKPGNILIADCGSRIADSSDQSAIRDPQSAIPLVTDFGLAKRLDEDSGVTRSGALVGTPEYMAPEQAAARPLTTAADVYSLGGILYTMLTGRPPFRGSNVLETLRQVTDQEPAAPASLARGVDRALEKVCLKCLEKDPRRRYASAEELADDLERWLRGEPVKARPLAWPSRLLKWARRRPEKALLAAVTVAAAAAIAVLGVLWYRTEVDRRHGAEAAKAELGHNLYVAHMHLAMQAWDEGHVARVTALLDRHVPRPGEEDGRSFEWYYLWRACHREDRVLPDHHRWVRSLAYSPDGRLLATGGYDAKVRVWEADTGRPVHVLAEHEAPVHRVAFSPDGRQLISGSDDTTVRIWDVETGKQTDCFKGHADKVWGVGFSGDGRWVASADISGRVFLRDRASLRPVEGRQPKIDPVNCLAFSPDGKLLVFGCDGGFVHIWDLEKSDSHKYSAHPGRSAVRSLTFAPDGGTFVCGCADGSARLWDAAANKPGRVLWHAHPTAGAGVSLWGVAYDSAGTTLATACWDGTVKLWDVQSGHERCLIRGHTAPVKSVAFAPRGGRLATASADGTVKLWPLPLETEPLAVSLPAPLERAGASPDGRRLLTVSRNGTVQLWDVFAGRELPVSPALRSRALESRVLALDENGGLLDVPGQEGEEKPPENVGRARTEPVALVRSGRPAVFSPDGKRLAALCPDRKCRVWDVADWRELAVIERLNSGSFSGLAFGPDGRTLALAGMERTRDAAHGVVRFYDVTTGKECGEPLAAQKDEVTAAAFAPDGRTLATGHPDGLVRLWDVATGQEKADFRPRDGRVLALTFTADGRALAALTQALEAPALLHVWRAASEEDVRAYAERNRH